MFLPFVSYYDGPFLSKYICNKMHVTLLSAFGYIGDRQQQRLIFQIKVLIVKIYWCPRESCWASPPKLDAIVLNSICLMLMVFKSRFSFDLSSLSVALPQFNMKSLRFMARHTGCSQEKENKSEMHISSITHKNRCMLLQELTGDHFLT